MFLFVPPFGFGPDNSVSFSGRVVSSISIKSHFNICRVVDFPKYKLSLIKTLFSLHLFSVRMFSRLKTSSLTGRGQGTSKTIEAVKLRGRKPAEKYMAVPVR